MKKRGFTLIELLAVILILGIISLIAIPTVNKVVKKARERASEASIVNYVDAVEKASSIEMLNENASLSSVTLDVSILNTKIDISGILPTSGSATLDDNGMVSSATFCINNYVVVYSDSKAKVDNTKNCTDATTTTDETVEFLNGATPILGTGLIPVTIENNGTVTYADTDKVWYDYENKKWANAVILSGGSYNVGDIISNDSIQSYFVWIPRYRYRLWNTGTAIKNRHSIDIVFESKDTTPSTGSNNEEYLTHPAFTTLDVNGIWVGKFETGYDGATTIAAAEVTANDSSKIIVKPNVFSWRNNTIYNIFMSSYNYNRSLGSHMMKNTEWGATAYLSHSKFGIETEANINNNLSFKTGYSALPSTNQQTYPGTYGDGATYNSSYSTEIGYLASTTGNITGIYDMSGGAWEYMASYMSGQLGNSGFNSTTIANTEYQKYLDVYNGSSIATSYQYRILGDATGEMGPFISSTIGTWTGYNNSWYADASYFIDSSYPWTNRGGSYAGGALAGQFYCNRYTGGVITDGGSRLVLVQ